MDLAAKHRLPTVWPWREAVGAGGFMSYVPHLPDLTRRAATYVDRILKGARPGELPVEQPTKLELVINLKTAKALGPTIPPSLLGRAGSDLRVKRKAAKPPPPPARAPAAQEPDAGSASVLPMEVQVGDRFTDHGFAWEVLTHPTAMHGAKTLRARVVRPGLPETEREVTWLAHERVAIRRGPMERRKAE